MTFMFGMLVMNAISSEPLWVTPSIAAVSPTCDALELRVQLRVTDEGPVRLKRSHCQECAVARDKYGSAVGGHARGGGQSVPLGDSQIEVAIRIAIAKQVRLAGFAGSLSKQDQVTVIGVHAPGLVRQTRAVSQS
jgi:hypothetical protein